MDKNMFDPALIDAEITPEVLAALNFLRDKGFAVAALSPTELQYVDPQIIEDNMVETGWLTIDMWKD